MIETAHKRIQNAPHEGVIVMFYDERTGDDQLEDDLESAARSRGYVLVENEDGDLVLEDANMDLTDERYL